MWPFKKLKNSLYKKPVLDNENYCLFENTVAIAVNSFEDVGFLDALKRIESIATVLNTLDEYDQNTIRAYAVYFRGLRTVRENNNKVILTQIATNTYVEKSAGTGPFTTADQYNIQMAGQRNLGSYKGSALANMHNLP